MSSSSGTFTYQPLQKPMDFRLLELRSGKQNETMQCSLKHCSLTSNPYYHAVSYTWGSPGDVRDIELNEIIHPIQANLFDFLQQLRLTYGSVNLWVDALCINQNDLTEKSIQVPLMGMIYSCANSVLVWLGPQADGSEVYFDYCNRETNPEAQAEKPFNTHRQSLSAGSDTTSMSTAIASLQRRTYWTRTWIIQEIVLASDIHVFCGDRSTHWPNFSLGMPKADTENEAAGMSNPTHPFGNLQKLRNIATRLTLRQLLFQCHMSRCSEPRDLIYGLLNVTKATSYNLDKISPDYNCSLERLFLQTMGSCPHVEYDGIPCLLFCDTLATRLELELAKVLDSANDISLFVPPSELTTQLASRAYFVKLTRFGRIVMSTSPVCRASLHLSTAESRAPQLAQWYSIREIPSTKSQHRLRSTFIPEATDTIFILNFESPHEAIYHLACICRPVHHNTNEEGVIPYCVVGLGIMLYHAENERNDRGETDVEREMDDLIDSLSSNLSSMIGLVVTDSIPGYGLDVRLLELISLCMFARRAGSFTSWSIDDTSASEHWQWK
jgi:hypothetical protein